jgi:hypothetical protein
MTSQSHHPIRRRWELSIRDQIAAVVAAVLVPCLLLGGWLVFRPAKQIRTVRFYLHLRSLLGSVR